MNDDAFTKLNDRIKELENEIKTIKDKTYEEVPKNGHVYILKCDGGFKIGKTYLPVFKRIKGLQTGNVNDIEIIFDCETNNADLLEKCVHDILYKYRCKSNREFFDCDLNYMKMIIEFVNTTFNTMKSTYQFISKEELYHKYIAKIEELKQKYDIDDYEEIEEEDYEVKQLLRENYCYSNDKKDFILFKEIKTLLKENNIVIYKESLINLINEMFPESEYCLYKCFNYKKYRSLFINLKRIQ